MAMFTRQLAMSALALMSVSSGVGAAQFGLSPMRVELTPAALTAVVNVSNDGDAPVTIQAQAYVWTQPDGKDTYAETRGFIISPPIFTVAPRTRQVVRVALRETPPTGNEQAYRLIFQEVPQAEEATSDTGATFRIAVAMNIPMFVKPVGPPVAPKASFGADMGPQALARLRIANDGTGNLRLTAVAVSQDDNTLAELGVFVVLPGATRFIDLPKDRVQPGKPLRVKAQGNGGPVDLFVPADKP
jgi:fimbrial chaperone protein